MPPSRKLRTHLRGLPGHAEQQQQHEAAALDARPCLSQQAHGVVNQEELYYSIQPALRTSDPHTKVHGDGEAGSLLVLVTVQELPGRGALRCAGIILALGLP